MADVISAISAVAGLLELSIRLADRAITAYEDAKTLSDKIARHQSDLRRIKSIVDLVQEEEALQTANVSSELQSMNGIAQRLKDALTTISRERGAARQLLRQFARGKRDKDMLSEIMDDMNRSTNALTLFISIAHVGVSRATGAGLVADREIIGRIDESLQELLGIGRGLKIARLLDGQRNSVDGILPPRLGAAAEAREVPITEADLLEMDKQIQSVSSTDEDKISEVAGSFESENLIINKNYAQDQSRMINGVLGQRDWIAGSKITIVGNKTRDEAVMFNGVFSSDIPAFKMIDT